MADKNPEITEKADLTRLRCYGAIGDREKPVTVNVLIAGDSYQLECSCLYRRTDASGIIKNGGALCTRDGRPIFSFGRCILDTLEKFQKIFS